MKPVRINYHFEEVQKVLFRVYDADDGEIDELSTLGSAETTLGTVSYLVIDKPGVAGWLFFYCRHQTIKINI